MGNELMSHRMRAGSGPSDNQLVMWNFQRGGKDGSLEVSQAAPPGFNGGEIGGRDVKSRLLKP